jgi:hypothetical protein
LGLTKPTYFYGTNVHTVLVGKFQERGLCPPDLFLKLEAAIAEANLK